MAEERDLGWAECYNVRDLGGLPCADGGWTRRGEVVRGDAPERLTERGWADAAALGVRTVVDLRRLGEAGVDRAPRPTTLTTHTIVLDDPADTAFWADWGAGLDCTPLYYPAFLERFPRRVARVLGVIADAPPGAVLVHCGSGRDRTGLVVLVLLTLAGVTPEAIADDYIVSTARLEPAWVEAGVGDQTGKIADLVARRGTTARASVEATARDLDAGAYLRDAGLRDDQLAALTRRLVG